ncbi:hypothetical protein CONLIGDRAFT_628326 [Coniochaeta ligniaria NRRL 30616]|uniref:Thioesterase/thiol ester dehydrase-isomerase n=1 Tax=Coniochaeta ligniaria NRRL 30616 TaxID=1408157 RepID=A0A1J7JTT0_9PEZI|nr:hypothetical protein CONLIGDRAFT_628326 [Coniochaeta ligniaria NRRL 30616]
MNAARDAALKAIPKRRDFVTGPFHRAAYLAAARELIAPGRPNPIIDYMSPTPSHLLNISLAGHIPPEVHCPTEFPKLFHRPQVDTLTSKPRPTPIPISDVPLPVGHHLVYFGPQATSSELMPDGTVADHCPGAHFTRRMWAGGRVRFSNMNGGGAWGNGGDENPPAARGDKTAEPGLWLDGRRAICVEKVVGDPVVKGTKGEEKVFVEISRKYGKMDTYNLAQAIAEVEEKPDIDETRTLVFMRERKDVKEAKALKNAGRLAAVPPVDKEKERDVARQLQLRMKTMVPTYSFSLTPDKKLLFQFSALTFNAHAIHLDRRYAQKVEGHKDLLVHGPLSLSLVLMAVRAQAARLLAEKGERVGLAELNYRNLAPLYVDEKMKVCVRMREGQTWDVWVEGPNGRFAVKGTATMQSLE